jgi:hypothetical protein
LSNSRTRARPPENLFVYVSPTTAAGSVYDVRLTVTQGRRTLVHEADGLPHIAPLIPWNRLHINLPGNADHQHLGQRPRRGHRGQRTAVLPDRRRRLDRYPRRLNTPVSHQVTYATATADLPRLSGGETHNDSAEIGGRDPKSAAHGRSGRWGGVMRVTSEPQRPDRYGRFRSDTDRERALPLSCQR